MAKKASKMGWRERLLLTGAMVAALVFLPATILLFIGMLPTMAARLVDRTPERTKAMTVGFMNFAGCFPFVYQLADSGLKLENTWAIVSQPLTVVVIYACATIGYVIEWVVTGVVAGLMVQKGKSRLELIRKTQEAMVKQWGPEVSGDLPLDQEGFPLENK